MAADNRTLSRGMYTAPLDVTNTWATNLDLTGTLRTGSLTHRLLWASTTSTRTSAGALFRRGAGGVRAHD